MDLVTAQRSDDLAHAGQPDEQQLFRRIARHILPVLFVCYIINYLDRVNIGFAKLQFLQDLHFNEAIFGFGAGLFYLGYMLFEVPSNLLLRKIGARLTLSRVLIFWGFVSAGMAFVRTQNQFYAMRLLLGIAEAGFFPGVILYLGFWFPRSYLGRITALFAIGAPVAGLLGSPISGWLLTLQGLHGLAGWQVLFIYEGLPAVVLGVIVFLVLEDRPAKSKWLTPAEKEAVQAVFARESLQKKGGGSFSVLQGLKTPAVYAGSFIYAFMVIGSASAALWTPTIYKSLGVAPTSIGLLTGLPYLFAIPSMYLMARHSDRTLERRWHCAMAILLPGIALALLPLSAGNLLFTVALFVVTLAGIWTAVPILFALQSDYLPDDAKPVGVAFVTTVGSLGGFLGPTIIGAITSETGSINTALSCLGGGLIVTSLLLIVCYRPRASTGREEI